MSGSVIEPPEEFSELKGSSDRKFGLVMAAACLLFALLPLWRGGNVRIWLALPGVLLLMAAIIYPRVLATPNRYWTRLGLLLSKVTNPLLMALLFFGGVWPMAMLMRLFGARPMGLSFDRNAATYWTLRTPRDPTTTMRKQF
jgi:hypothetical protein